MLIEEAVFTEFFANVMMNFINNLQECQEHTYIEGYKIWRPPTKYDIRLLLSCQLRGLYD